jgi:hypothetical protein
MGTYTSLKIIKRPLADRDVAIPEIEKSKSL